MYEDFMKVAQESMKPMLKMAENNTAMAVKLMKAQADTTAEMMQSNLAHVQALVEVKDLNVAVDMQQKYVESVNEKLTAVARDNAAVIEAAMTELGHRPFRLPSGAGHDAGAMAEITDIGMIFVRCEGGISHHPAESITRDDAIAGAELLLRAVEKIGGRNT